MQDLRHNFPRLAFPLGTLRTPTYRKTFKLILLALSLGCLALVAASVQAQVQTYSCPTAFGPVIAAPVLPAVLMQSLRTVPNPVLPNGPLGVTRLDLTDYIANQQAAIQLGKAFFWEMQAGSDNKTACATCHFSAGADSRTRNQMNPGANNSFDSYAGLAPNYAFNGSGNDFPFTVPLNRDSDNISGSQGVRMSLFSSIGRGGVEQTTPVADSVFNVGGVNVRQVTGKNAPTMINAVFNHRLFWNGRAQPEFNGVNPFGNRDANARVWVVGTSGTPALVDIHILNAALASQAVGPALSTVEMSASNRSFADLGHKLLLVKPLGLQKVDPNDSVLGGLADTSTGKGLTVTYTSLIQTAFKSKWWNSKKNVTVNGKTYTMMEANMSLFWGLAIMFYESTLVSDNSAMDQYLLSRQFSNTVFDPVTGVPQLLSDDPTLLDQAVSRLSGDGISVTRTDILNGLALFERPVSPPPSFPVPSGFGVGCIGCHVGAETTSASIRNLTGPGIEAGDAALKAAGFDLRMERMFMKVDWTPPGPLTPVPLGTDTITFDPSTYAVNVVDEIIPFPGGFSTPISPAIPLPVATYDAGWYNLGVRTTTEDLGVGGLDPFNSPLSWTELFKASASGIVKIPGNGLGCVNLGNVTFPNTLLNAQGFPLLSGPLISTEASDVAGTFKVPNLRNVEFTGPYFHNGGKATLAQVVEFYDSAGDFDRTTNPTKAPALVPLMLDGDKQKALVAFLLSLTDDRVRMQQAPFDHPEILVPNGDIPAGTDNMIDIPATGAAGSSTPIQRFLGLNPLSL